MTISGYPIGNDEDMAYHRATGEQVPKGFDTMGAERLMLDSEAFLRGGRTTIYVGDDVDFDKLAARDDLPEGVEIVTVNPALFPEGWDGVVIDDSPPPLSEAGIAALMALGASAGLASMFSSVGKSLLDAQTSLQDDIDAGIFNDILTPGYVPMFEGYEHVRPDDLRLLSHPYAYPEGASYSLSLIHI